MKCVFGVPRRKVLYLCVCCTSTLYHTDSGNPEKTMGYTYSSDTVSELAAQGSCIISQEKHSLP